MKYRKASLLAGDSLEDVVATKERPSRIRGRERRTTQSPREVSCSSPEVSRRSPASRSSPGSSPQHSGRSSAEEASSSESGRGCRIRGFRLSSGLSKDPERSSGDPQSMPSGVLAADATAFGPSGSERSSRSRISGSLRSGLSRGSERSSRRTRGPTSEVLGPTLEEGSASTGIRRAFTSRGPALDEGSCSLQKRRTGSEGSKRSSGWTFGKFAGKVVTDASRVSSGFKAEPKSCNPHENTECGTTIGIPRDSSSCHGPDALPNPRFKQRHATGPPVTRERD